MTKQVLMSAFVALGAMLVADSAQAHVSIGSGPGTTNATNEILFNVGHGCAGDDTYRVVVEIPAGVTSVRGMQSIGMGSPTTAVNVTSGLTELTWQKPLAELLPEDTGYYRLPVRMKLPDAPFSTLYFKVLQTCRDDADSTETVVEWVGTPAVPAAEPAASIVIVPAKLPGWNRYTLTVAIADADLPAYFVNSLIVWRGTSAYSVNPLISALILATPGITPLTTLVAGDEIWVRY